MSESEKIDDIHETLARLHEELQSLDAVDDATRQELMTVVQDIRKLISEPESEEQSQSLKESLEESAIKFESSHPVLANLLQRITDGLASLGI